jgi:hypothetical protein
MVDLNGFNADEHESSSFEPVPKGDYLVNATSSEWKDTKDKKGQYLQFDFTILRGPYADQKLFARLNLKHKNQKVVQIANGELADICRAVGVLRPHDSAELHNKPLVVSVDLEERADKKGSYSNNIKKFFATSGAATPEPLATETETTPLGRPIPPWKRSG